jgi:hypothetical protein
MKFLVLAVTFFSLSGVAFCQRRSGQFWSLGGYGNVLFPGTGHAPPTPPGGFAGPYFPRGPVHTPTPHDLHPPSNTIFPSAVYDSGYTNDQSGIYARGDPNQTPQETDSIPAPPVIINQSFAPPQVPQPCSNAPVSALRSQIAHDDRPTIYLLAFKDHRIVRALGYWMDAATLHYVSTEYGLNQASIDLIDQDLSQRLNDERGVAFNLPAAK